jgi:tetratricopeptide (TPR) repeat protein
LEAQLGNLAEAKKYFERSVELDPDSAPAAYCNLGMALAGDGKSAEAIESFEKALAFNRDFQIAHMQLGIELTKVDRIDEAIFHFEQAIKIDPNVAFPYYQIAQLRRKQGHNVDADKYQRLGVKTTRRFAEGENRRGLELANEGKLNQAIKRFETAIAVAPDYADAYCNLGDVLAREGHIEEAAERYRQAININPGFTRARVQLERMFSP